MSRLIDRIPNIMSFADHAPASQYDSFQVGLLARLSSFFPRSISVFLIKSFLFFIFWLNHLVIIKITNFKRWEFSGMGWLGRLHKIT